MHVIRRTRRWNRRLAPQNLRHKRRCVSKVRVEVMGCGANDEGRRGIFGSICHLVYPFFTSIFELLKTPLLCSTLKPFQFIIRVTLYGLLPLFMADSNDAPQPDCAAGNERDSVSGSGVDGPEDTKSDIEDGDGNDAEAKRVAQIEKQMRGLKRRKRRITRHVNGRDDRKRSSFDYAAYRLENGRQNIQQIRAALGATSPHSPSKSEVKKQRDSLSAKKIKTNIKLQN